MNMVDNGARSGALSGRIRLLDGSWGFNRLKPRAEPLSPFGAYNQPEEHLSWRHSDLPLFPLLYMPALTASRHNPELKEFYERLVV